MFALTQKIGIVGMGVLFSGTAAIAQQADNNKGSEISIVQERLYDKKREVGFTLGYLPDDNFYESFPLTVNFIHHFNERYAWEVIRASYMINQERDIKRDLEENFGVTPSTFDEFTSHIETSFMIKPTYGKDSFWNNAIVNHEGYFSFGVGAASFEKKYSFDPTEQETALTASIGAGRKYFISKSFNISLDIKNLTVFKESKAENYIYLGIGIHYRFNGFGSGTESKPDNNSIYHYLQ